MTGINDMTLVVPLTMIFLLIYSLQIVSTKYQNIFSFYGKSNWTYRSQLHFSSLTHIVSVFHLFADFNYGDNIKD